MSAELLTALPGLTRLLTRLTVAVVITCLPWALHAADSRRGELPYKVCASCHGFKGEGNVLVQAPALAGQEAWYLSRQIENFRRGIRGGDADDRHARQMALMTRGLTDARMVEELVAYITTLPGRPTQARIAGDAGRGQNLYAPCAACHGARGEGNATMNAPALAGMADWYQLAQLEKFRDGRRGRHPQDVYGAQMAPMAAVLADEAAARDVIAYINSRRDMQ